MDTVALARDRQSSLARLMLFALLASESTLRSATCTISTRRREYRSQSWPIYPHRSRHLFPYCGPPVRLANSFRAPAISSRPPVGSGAARSLGHRAFGTNAKLNCYPPESQVAFVRRLSTTAAQRNQPAKPQETRRESGSRQTSRFLVPHLSQAAAGTERTPLYRKDCRKPICPNLLFRSWPRNRRLAPHSQSLVPHGSLDCDGARPLRHSPCCRLISVPQRTSAFTHSGVTHTPNGPAFGASRRA